MGIKCEYYVIVDTETLEFMCEGNRATIEEADRYKTLEEAKKELVNYDEDFTGAIYKVTEYIDRKFELAR